MLFNRLLFYILAGISSALFGLSISWIFLIDFGQFFKETDYFKEHLANTPPDLILLPIVAGCLAFAMVGMEIYSSHPTRYKFRSFKNLAIPYLILAIIAGLMTGLLSALLSWILYSTHLSSGIIRVIAWTLIGLFIGLGEGISWRLRSIEGQTSKAKFRLIKSTLLGFLAGFIAAVLIEIIRQLIDLNGWEDVLGFAILGLSLGYFLNIGASPTYQGALRAGKGFEFYEQQSDQELPKLQNSSLRFVTEDSDDDDDMIIEEGLSIELPSKLDKTLIIGSKSDADIYIPQIPEECAKLSYKEGKYILRCLAENKVQVNQDKKIKKDIVILRHNQIITFYHANDNQRFYRFVFYDRFLDPQT